MGFGRITSGAEAYAEVSAYTATPWQLIDDLYGGAIFAIKQGKISKAFRIVNEGLFLSIDPKQPHAQGLAKSYEKVMADLIPGGSPSRAMQSLQDLRNVWIKFKK